MESVIGHRSREEQTRNFDMKEKKNKKARKKGTKNGRKKRKKKMKTKKKKL